MPITAAAWDYVIIAGTPWSHNSSCLAGLCRAGIKCSWWDDRAKSYQRRNATDMNPKTFRSSQEVGLTCLMVLATRLSSTGPLSSWRR